MAYFLVFFIFFWSSNVFGKDLGTHGQVFEIKERHLLKYIQEKSTNFSLERLHEIKQNYKPSFKPVIGLSEAKEYRIFYFDPKVCAQQDILDHLGNTIIPKGTCVNPLDIVSWPCDMLFLDGTNKQHLSWARKQKNNSNWVFINGNPFELEENEERKIYFDQHGLLCQKLDLKNIPAKVTQKGKLLQIEEIPVMEMNE